MSRLLFDCETNGFLDELTTIHSLVITDVDTGESVSYADQPGYRPISEGVQRLLDADELIGHNIIKFDIPAIAKVYPWFKPRGRFLDTLVLARLLWPELKHSDDALIKKGKLPKKLKGKYSLESFGYRLGKWKGEYSDIMKAAGLDPWAAWNKDMQDYCEQDVVVNLVLYRKAMLVWRGEDDKGLGVPYSDKSIWMEMDVATIVARQERWGFGFNVPLAEKFYVVLLARREVLDVELRGIFGSWNASGGTVDVKKTRRVKRKDLPPLGFKTRKRKITDPDGNHLGFEEYEDPIYVTEIYEEGSRYSKVKRVDFNPASNQHIANRLTKLFGWRPQEFTPSGEVKVDETVLSQLPWPEAKVLTEYLTVAKRIAQLAEGKQAWLKKERNGRIHGGVITVGAVTRRMTHSNPNVAQVPKVGSPYGAECRELFTSTTGFVLVGCDADALELRCLAGYMSVYDGGEYIETVLSGDKSLGTDMHSVNARALGLDPKKKYPVDGKDVSGRDIAKTWFYAFIYGAGDFKLGAIMGTSGADSAIIAAGKKSRDNFLKGLPALGKLVEMVQKRAFGYVKKSRAADGSILKKKIPGRGFLVGLDGGKLKVRSKHAALNTLLQSAGAIIMKVALVILDRDLQALGLVPGLDYEFCANVHDEWQIDVLPQHVALVKETAELSIKKAGEELEFGCPLAGNADEGTNWKDTH